MLLTLSFQATAQTDLPCEQNTPECVEQLTARAVENSREIRLLDETIKLAKRKGWTQYIDVSAIDPLTLSIQIVRNLLGGGERQERKLRIKSLEVARATKAEELKTRIIEFLSQIESAKRRTEYSRLALENHQTRLALVEINYRSGEGSTETMLTLWQRTDALKAEIEAAETEAKAAWRKLSEIIAPPTTRETARAAVIEQITKAWISSGTNEELNLIVLNADENGRVFKSEFLKIFPEGAKHLPNELKPREIYTTNPNGKRKVQYLGRISLDGFNFFIFRYVDFSLD